MKKKKSWYKPKRYLHFDYLLPKASALAVVSDPNIVAEHSFLPFIHYIKTSRRYRKDKKTGRLIADSKKRHIFYASHVDGYIYGYYAERLLAQYNELIRKHSLDENILAYRSIKKNGQKHSNIEMSSEVFSIIKATDGCNVLCLDINGFFDNLCVIKLKEKWCQVLSVNKLPDDYYNLYWHITNFRFVDETDCITIFGTEPRNCELPGGSSKNRVCSFKELERAHKEKKSLKFRLVKKKTDLVIDGVPFKGIPQGSPISGLLSNIFMFDFDIAIQSYIQKLGGIYRRYSDDIIIAFPPEKSFNEVEGIILQTLRSSTNGSLTLNKKKTERRIYKPAGNGGQPICLNADTRKPSRIQYLGFTFDGLQIHIRNSSISKNRAKIANTIRMNKKRKGNINTRAVYKAQSPRKITQMDKPHNKGFVYYAGRAATAQNAESITKQIRKNDRFIREKITEERSHKARNR